MGNRNLVWLGEKMFLKIDYGRVIQHVLFFDNAQVIWGSFVNDVFERSLFEGTIRFIIFGQLQHIELNGSTDSIQPFL
jgi:hypothetical protein